MALRHAFPAAARRQRRPRMREVRKTAAVGFVSSLRPRRRRRRAQDRLRAVDLKKDTPGQRIARNALCKKESLASFDTQKLKRLKTKESLALFGRKNCSS
jgi:ribosomal protein L32